MKMLPDRPLVTRDAKCKRREVADLKAEITQLMLLHGCTATSCSQRRPRSIGAQLPHRVGGRRWTEQPRYPRRTQSYDRSESSVSTSERLQLPERSLLSPGQHLSLIHI